MSEAHGSRGWLARLILDVRAGNQYLDRDTLQNVRVESSTLNALVRAAQHHCGGRPTMVSGLVYGDVLLSPRVAGRLEIHTEIHGALRIIGREASVGDDLFLEGSTFGPFFLGVPVAGDVRVRGVVKEGFVVKGSIGRILRFDPPTHLGGDVVVNGTVGSGVVLNVAVAGSLRLWRAIGSIYVSQRVNGTVDVNDAISSNAEFLDAVGGDFTILAPVGRLSLAGASLRGRVALTPSAGRYPTRLVSVRGARFFDEVFVGDNVDISTCDFRQCPDLDRLSLVGADLFPTNRVLANPPSTINEDVPAELVPAHELASIYRQLRSGLEHRNNRPAAGTFYRGEMTARRAAATWKSAEWWVLTAYWVASGYGLRAARAAFWFVVFAVAGACLFQYRGFDLDEGVLVDRASFLDAFTFSVKSMVSFFSPPSADLGLGGEWVQVGLRFAGPILLAQLLFATREHVAR